MTARSSPQRHQDRRGITRVAVLVTVALLVVLVSAESVSAAFPGENGDIAYVHVSGSDGRVVSQIRTVSPDGSGSAKLVGGADQPAWRPDGKRLAYVRWVDGAPQIFTMAADGTGRRRITDFRYGAEQPSWSPDGKHLVFASYSDGPLLTSIWRIRAADGRDLRRIVGPYDAKDRPTFAWEPVWGVGGRIAYSAAAYVDGVGDSALYSIRPDGTQRRRLTPPTSAFEPDWSPDGRRLVYKRYHGNTPTTLHVMNADGSGRRTIVDTDGWVHEPTWSPTGRLIVFTSIDSGTPGEPAAGLYLVRPDGSRRRRILDGDFNALSWQPR